MRSKPFVRSLTFVCVFALAGAARPAAAQVPTIDESLEMRSAANPRISPDGRWVAYVVSRTNWDDNAFERDIWIASTTDGERYRLTSAKKSSSSPAWSPDGRWLAFLSNRPATLPGTKEDTDQIYLISPTGGEARQLTKVETGVQSFAWSLDGRRIAFTAADPESKAHKERTEKYGEYQIVGDDYTMTHLWMLDVPGPEAEKPPEPQRLTEGDTFTVDDFAWSPDSTRIAFSAPRDPDLSDEDTADIYVLTLNDKSVRKIVDTPGPDTNPKWSPDGKEIAYETSNGQKDFYYRNTFIAVVPAAGGAPRLLTESFDENPFLLAWAPDGIYFSALQKTYAHLFRMNPAHGPSSDSPRRTG